MKRGGGHDYKRLMLPAMLLHLVCCGGLLLFVLVGSAGFTAIAAFLRDPLVQVIALGGLVALWVLLWARRPGRLRGSLGSRSMGASRGRDA